MEADLVTMAAYNSCDLRSSQCIMCPTCSACHCAAHIPLLAPAHGCCLQAHHHDQLLLNSDSSTSIATNNNSIHGSEIFNPNPKRDEMAAEDGIEVKRAGKKRPATPTGSVISKKSAGSVTSKKSGATVSPLVANDSTTTISHLTRNQRQRLSLPLPKPSLDLVGPRKTGKKKQASKSKPGIAKKQNVPEPQLFFDTETETENRAEPDSHDESSANLGASNRNANASKEKTEGKDQNVNACKPRRVKSERFMLANCKRNAAVQKALHIPSARRVVSMSALKPIRATCSRSGMGLVVTYRPVFSEAAKKKRKRPLVTTIIPKTSPVAARRDSGTSPRTPSPYGRGRETIHHYDRFKVVHKRKTGSQQKDTGVKKWLQDIPRSGTSQKRKHSPDHRKNSSANRDGHKPFVTAKCAARKSPIPGPSWSPEELKRAACRPRSPYYMSGRSRQQRKESSRSAPPKSRPGKPGGAMTEVYNAGKRSPSTQGGRRTRSPLSQPPSSRFSSSEGWDITRNTSTQKKDRDRLKKDKGAEDRGRGDTGHHAAASDSRSDHDHGLSRSRSSSRTTSSTSDKDEDDERRDRRHRHFRHHRYRHEPEREDSDKGGCQVM